MEDEEGIGWAWAAQQAVSYPARFQLSSLRSGVLRGRIVEKQDSMAGAGCRTTWPVIGCWLDTVWKERGEQLAGGQASAQA